MSELVLDWDVQEISLRALAWRLDNAGDVSLNADELVRRAAPAGQRKA